LSRAGEKAFKEGRRVINEAAEAAEKNISSLSSRTQAGGSKPVVPKKAAAKKAPAKRAAAKNLLLKKLLKRLLKRKRNFLVFRFDLESVMQSAPP